jgi:hypothetical protein
MDDDKIVYQYSKNTCFLYSVLLLIIIVIGMQGLLDVIKHINSFDLVFFGAFSFIPIIGLVFITIKFSLPAIKGKIAFEINQQGVTDHIRNFSFKWDEISDLRMSTNREGNAFLYIYFKRPNGKEDYKRTLLMWVKGSDLEIYGIIEANMEDRGFRRN